MKAMIALVLVSALVSGGIAVSDSSDADEGFTVTDSTGKTFTYSAASEHIIVTGYAATLTIIESGMAEKIYAVDQYGAVAFDDKGLERPANVWTTTYNDTSALKSNIVHAGESGFDIAGSGDQDPAVGSADGRCPSASVVELGQTDALKTQSPQKMVHQASGQTVTGLEYDPGPICPLDRPVREGERPSELLMIHGGQIGLHCLQPTRFHEEMDEFLHRPGIQTEIPFSD
ncbi:hypothetical protein [Methanomethylophilus alvi]|uniref:hypothetical protein n=1 Tax=Methanomethylophilus alvi TaxID=1291540 RepID=UPI0037DD4EA2